MYNGKEENKQKMLDFMCGAIQEMRANGTPGNNPIVGLKLITREEDERTFFGFFPKGDYVRIQFENNPERNDGYYDVNVEGCSCFGMFEDVWSRVKRSIG